MNFTFAENLWKYLGRLQLHTCTCTGTGRNLKYWLCNKHECIATSTGTSTDSEITTALLSNTCLMHALSQSIIKEKTNCCFIKDIKQFSI